MAPREVGRRALLAAGAGLLTVRTAGTSVQAQTPAPPFLNVRDFGAVGDGVTDDTAAIQAALQAGSAELGTIGQGATVMLPGGVYRCTAPLSLDGRCDCTLTGRGALQYGGTSAPFLSLKSAKRITFEHVTLSYSNPSFNGALVAAGTLGLDPAYLYFDDVNFWGVQGAHQARALIDVTFALFSELRRCRFANAQVGIVGTSTGYANVIGISGCAFQKLDIAAIHNGGESWTIDGCGFEPLTSGRATAYTQDLVYFAYGLTFSNCWFGDVTMNGGSWITARALGLTLLNNRFATPGRGPSDVCVRFNACQAVNVQGNRFEGPTNLDFGPPYSWGVTMLGNDFQGQRPLLTRNIVNQACWGNNNLPNYAG